MSKILLMSDSHGQIDLALEVMKKNKDVDAVLHAGDIEGDQDRLRSATPHQVAICRGNCDWGPGLPEQIILPFGKRKIGLIHGHRYLRYGGADSLAYWGMEQGVDLVVFGHTHVPYWEEVGKICLINPGSISRPRQEGYEKTYGLLDLGDQSLSVEIRRAQDHKVLRREEHTF
ncbi:MAG: metallophosphoesterase [Eubacterium sp.]|nr:metallophosphoesterase [Eubacterium sp.]